MIKTPKDHIKILIDKYENHVKFCKSKYKEAKDSKMLSTATLWNEEKTTYEKVLIDLYKVLKNLKTNTNLTEFPKRELEQYRSDHEGRS
jgi:hypothetical protein